MAKEEPGKTPQEQIPTLKLVIPDLFNKPNTLFDLIRKAKSITIQPDLSSLSFSFLETHGQSSERHEFSYEKIAINEGGDRDIQIKTKWVFSYKNKVSSEVAEEKTRYEIAFIGDIDENNNEHNPSDRIVIHDYQNKKSILIDFKNKKIGIKKGKIGGSSLNRYEDIITFEEAINNDEIRQFEYNEVEQLVAFLGFDNKEIILPVSLSYNPGVKKTQRQESLANSLASNEEEVFAPLKIKKLIPETGITIVGVEILLLGDPTNPTLKIGEMVLTFQQLQILFYRYGLPTRISEIPRLVEGIKQGNIKSLLGQIVSKNFKLTLEDCSDPIITIFNKAVSLKIMNLEFIEALKVFLSELGSE